MSEKTTEDQDHGDSGDRIDERKRAEMDEVQEQLDAESDEDGLGAEAGSAEENGISQG